MSHHSEINHDQTEPISGAIGLWTSFFVVLLVGITVLSILLYKGMIEDSLRKAQDVSHGKEIEELRVYEKTQLTSCRWIDQKRGIVQIPIETAKRKVVEDYN